MKKIVFLSLFVLCLPLTLQAQSIDDDLYYVPSKKKENVKQNKESKVEEIVIESNDSTTSLTSSTIPIVVKDYQGNIRDVDEYNRRFDSNDHNFSFDNDTLYIEEKPYTGLDGEWVNGFDGSEDDYEYATRIIRFRNPRYAISVSSPLYWEVVYGLNSWDWNVYTDGLYAYVFPTYTNRLWWDWRFNYYGWWGYPYYGWGWYPYYYGWYGLGWSYSFYHHPVWHSRGWYSGNHWAHNTFTNRRSSGGTLSSMGRTRSGSSTLSRSRGTTMQGGSSSSYRRSGQGGISTTRRVVGTRTSSERNTTSTHTGTINSTTTQQRGSYTRPSNTHVGTTSTLSTRNSSTVGNRRINTTATQRTTRSTPTQSRGSYSARSTGSSRSYSTGGGSARSGGGGGGGARRR